MPTDPQAVDDLRRRLYRADATEDDVRRYLDVRAEPEPSSAEPVRTAPSSSPSRRRTARWVAVAGLVAVAAVAVALLAAPGAGRPAPATSAAPAATVLADVGDGSLLDVGEGRVSTAAAVVTAVGSTPVLGRRVEGRGSAVVALDPESGDVDGGRSVVAVATSGSRQVTWRALLEAKRPDWSTAVFVLARGRAASPTDAVRATTFTWRARPPTHIAVMAPAGVRWAVVYAAIDGPAAALH